MVVKRIVLSLALACLLALGGQAFASSFSTGAPLGMCDISATPAATLLLPYFEQDLDNVDGITTLFAIGNASAAPTIAHVTVWTDLSVPVFDFDIYLTGFDIQTINLRDVLVNGVLPVTYHGRILGSFSVLGSNFPNCGTSAGVPPRYAVPAIGPSFLAHIQAWLTGQASPVTGNCAGRSFGDRVARGYITIDDANSCSLLFPSDVGYFGAGGTGIASNDNTLFGDYFLVDPANNFAQGETLVHIEAETDFRGLPNGYTFYSRYGTLGVDEREPLPTVWASRHIVGGLFNGGTDLLVWRDSTSSAASPFTCGGAPVWFPLEAKQIVIFDEEENPVLPPGQVSGEPEEQLNPFPAEAQRVVVGGPSLPLQEGFNFGWLYLNLNHLGNDNPFASDPMSAQAWVTTVASALGRFSVGWDAIALDSACDPFTSIIP